MSQVEVARAALGVIEAQREKLRLAAPAGGVVLSRSVEPGEVAVPGAPLMTLAKLDDLKITVYVPEDRYGSIQLGESAQVSVDSFPGQVFTATVTRIADQAEFTPRNVQTEEGRRTTVFAVELKVDNPDSKLKPGMPADVSFEQN
jgi:multidrug resistance efflux pump